MFTKPSPGAAEESRYWGHSSPGKRSSETLENTENIHNREH